MPADWGFISLEMTQLHGDVRAVSQHLPGGYGKAKGRLFTAVNRVQPPYFEVRESDSAARKELSPDRYANKLPKEILESLCVEVFKI